MLQGVFIPADVQKYDLMTVGNLQDLKPNIKIVNIWDAPHFRIDFCHRV
jgi:hypothetical protein